MDNEIQNLTNNSQIEAPTNKILAKVMQDLTSRQDFIDLENIIDCKKNGIGIKQKISLDSDHHFELMKTIGINEDMISAHNEFNLLFWIASWDF